MCAGGLVMRQAHDSACTCSSASCPCVAAAAASSTRVRVGCMHWSCIYTQLRFHTLTY